MAASFPSSVKSFSTKSTTDTVEAGHVNDLQDEVTAIETDLLTNGLMLRLKAGSYSAGDTTPTVSGVSRLTITNSGATTITNFDDGVEGQVIVLIFSDANTTVDRTNCYLDAGANFTSSAQDTLTLIKIGTRWHELSRGVIS